MLVLRRLAVRHAKFLSFAYQATNALLGCARPLLERIGDSVLERPFAAAEGVIKGALFDCRMCGQCVLSSTGMSCPMNCPKQMRNGPCGGVRADGNCEVLPAMRCVWMEALDGERRIHRDETREAIVRPPLDHSLKGRSAWLRVVREDGTQADGKGRTSARAGLHAAARAATGRVETPTSRREEVVPRSRLERLLRSGCFAVTAELSPPDSADPADVMAAAQPLMRVVDAINATDASGAHCHMSSMGISSILSREGVDVVLQMSCRDRNRIAIQGDVLGAAAMGVGNVLCLTGDGVAVGDHPEARPVFDLDSVSLLSTLRTMRDSGRFLSGRRITSPPRIFLGAAENPCVPPFEQRAQRLAAKVAAGADFIQTNYVFDVPMLERFMKRVGELNLAKPAHILVGIGPLPSAATAKWLREHVPGIHVPDALLERLARASNPVEEGKRICIETIRRIREIEGVAGVHLMAYRREHLIEEIVAESGVLAGRSPEFVGGGFGAGVAGSPAG